MSGEEAVPRPAKPRRWPRVLAWAAVLPGLVLLVLLLLSLPPVQRSISRLVAERAAGALEAKIGLESLNWNLWNGSLELEGVTVTGTQERAGTSASLGSLRVDLSVPALLEGRIEVESLTVDRLGAALLLDEKGHLILPVRLPPSEPEKEKRERPRVTVRRVQLARAWLDLMERGERKRHFEVKDVALDAALELPALDSKGSLSIAEIRIGAAGQDPLGGTSVRAEWNLVRGSGKAEGRVSGQALDLALEVQAELRDVLSTPSYVADLSLQGSLDRIGARLAPGSSLGGRVEARLKAAGSEAAIPDVSGTIRGWELTGYGRSIERLDLVADMAGGRLRKGILDLNLAGGSAHLEATATVMPGLADIAFQSRLEGIDIGQLLPPAKKGPRIAGRLSATVAGNLPEPRLSAAVVSVEASLAREARVPAGTVSPEVLAKLDLNKGLVNVESLTLKDGPASVAAEGKYDLARTAFEGRLEIVAPQIAPYLALAGIEGKGSVEASLRGSGTLERPAVTGQVRGRSLVVSGAAIDRVDLDARVEGRRFEVDSGSVAAYGIEAEADARGTLPSSKGSSPEVDLRVCGITYARQRFPDVIAHATMGETIQATLETPDGRIKATGKMPPRAPAQADVTVDRLDLSVLAGFLPERFKEFSGELSGEAHATRWPSGKAEASVVISSLSLAVAGRKVSSPGIEAGVTGDTVDIRRFQLDADEGTSLSVSGRMAVDGSEVSLRTRLAVPDLAAWHAFVPDAPALSGTLSADVELSGSLRKPAATGSVSAKGIGAGDASVERIDLTLGLKEGADLFARLHITGVRKGEYRLERVELEASRRGDEIQALASTLDGQVRLDATATISESWPVTATLELSALDPGPFLRTAGAPKDLEATVTGSIRARGRAVAPESFSVSAEIRELRASTEGRTFSATQPVRLDYENDRLVVSSFELRGQNATFDLSGRLPMKGDSNEKLRLSALFDLEGALGFVSALDRAKGQLTADIEVTNSLARPHVSGKLLLTGGILDGPSFPAPIEKLEASLTATPTIVTLEKLSAEIAGGPVLIQGSLGLKDRSPKTIDATLRVRDVDMEVIRDLQVRSSADIALKGTWPNLAVNGQVRVDDATYIPALDLNGILKSLKSRRVVRTERKNKDENQKVNLSLDIAVVAKDAIHLQGNLGEADAGGVLQVKGTLDDPVVLGSIAALSGGSMNLLGSKWELTQARADFSDPLNIDPDLIVVATTTKAEEEITVTIRGQASNAQLLLSSSKGRSQADIMTLLVGGSGGGSAALADAAASMAVRGAATPLLGSLGKSTDMEVVPLPTSPEGEKFLFSVAKDLGGGLTATYFKGMSGETADAFEMRWRVSSRVKGRVRQNQDGTLSGGFRIKREFN